jgi:hypothetical protein
MVHDMERQRQFNDILDAADGNAGALITAASMLDERDAAMAANLRLIAQLRQIAPPRSEIESARLRIGQRVTREVFGDISDEDARMAPLRSLRLSEPPAPDDQSLADLLNKARAHAARAHAAPAHTLTGAHVSAVGPRNPLWRHVRKRAAMGAFAAATLLLALGVGLSYASADSLPGSPLYGLKRGEESLMLVMPQSVESHARTLSMIAVRRLVEAQAESRAHHDTQAKMLLQQYNDAMNQLIGLAATIKSQHGDNSVVTAQILQVLAVQATIQQTTIYTNDPVFASALENSVAQVQRALDQSHIATPNANGANPNSEKDHGNQPNSAPTPSPTVAPTSAPTASPTPSPSPSPTPSNRHEHGHTATR